MLHKHAEATMLSEAQKRGLVHSSRWVAELEGVPAQAPSPPAESAHLPSLCLLFSILGRNWTLVYLRILSFYSMASVFGLILHSPELPRTAQWASAPSCTMVSFNRMEVLRAFEVQQFLIMQHAQHVWPPLFRCYWDIYLKCHCD